MDRSLAIPGGLGELPARLPEGGRAIAAGWAPPQGDGTESASRGAAGAGCSELGPGFRSCMASALPRGPSTGRKRASCAPRALEVASFEVRACIAQRGQRLPGRKGEVKGSQRLAPRQAIRAAPARLAGCPEREPGDHAHGASRAAAGLSRQPRGRPGRSTLTQARYRLLRLAPPRCPSPQRPGPISKLVTSQRLPR